MGMSQRFGKGTGRMTRPGSMLSGASAGMTPGLMTWGTDDWGQEESGGVFAHLRWLRLSAGTAAGELLVGAATRGFSMWPEFPKVTAVSA